MNQVAVFLSPGEYVVGDERYRVTTLLGSCVSITLWDARRKVGAISHFLLAERHCRQAATADDAHDGRYGTEALTLMLHDLAERGVQPGDCVAKLFGGGDMFPSRSRGDQTGIGRRNGDIARELLAAHGIRVVSHSLFGTHHRKIVFDMSTGDVWLRGGTVDGAQGQQMPSGDALPCTPNRQTLGGGDAPPQPGGHPLPRQ